ncbi:hypothetical protein EG342_17320 [Chryseobacterium lactis]|nr:hypothetical protein EG342_17320 [Chryseobacterium lactis]
MNKGKDIIFRLNYVDTQSKEVIEEIIKNNTNNTYVVDPLGFYGKSFVLENGKILDPYLYFKSGYYSRNDRACYEDLIILKPFQTIHRSIIFNKNNQAVYRYKKSNKYEEIVKSFHNKNNVTILGCESYIKELESKGYKVLEDSIVTKLLLQP